MPAWTGVNCGRCGHANDHVGKRCKHLTESKMRGDDNDVQCACAEGIASDVMLCLQNATIVRQNNAQIDILERLLVIGEHVARIDVERDEKTGQLRVTPRISLA